MEPREDEHTNSGLGAKRPAKDSMWKKGIHYSLRLFLTLRELNLRLVAALPVLNLSWLGRLERQRGQATLPDPELIQVEFPVSG